MRCKQGDMAYVVKAPLGGPIGIVVKVERFDSHHEHYGPLWLCIGRDPLPTIGLGDRKDVLISDDWLRPIGGVPIHDEVTDDMELTV